MSSGVRLALIWVLTLGADFGGDLGFGTKFLVMVASQDHHGAQV
jgi:hypothetical protein